MHRSLLLLVLACCASVASANQIQLSPQIIAVANAEHSPELTLSLLPSPGTSAVSADVTLKLDRFGWVQVLPAAAASGRQASCVLQGGVVRALLLSTSGIALPTGNTIPICRIRVRAHATTARGNYYITQANPIALNTAGDPLPAMTNSVRVIVF